MSLSGIRDVDREVLKHVDDSELLKICSVNRKTWNEVCDDNFLRRRLSVKYPGVEKYKKQRESWKRFFLRLIHSISKMEEEYGFVYEDGDFEEQYELLKNYQGDLLLQKSADRGILPLVKYTVEAGMEVDIYNALRLAAANGNLEIVKYLIKAGENIHMHADLEAALITASRYGHLNVVKFLVENGADLHIHDDISLAIAAEYGRLDVLKYLVEHGADIVTSGALEYAADKYEIVNYLTEYLRNK